MNKGISIKLKTMILSLSKVAKRQIAIAAACLLFPLCAQADTFINVHVSANPGQTTEIAIISEGFWYAYSFFATGSYSTTIRLEDHFNPIYHSWYVRSMSASDVVGGINLTPITIGSSTAWSVTHVGYDKQAAMDVSRVPDTFTYLPVANKGFWESLWGPVALATGAETFEKSLLSVQGVRTLSYSLLYDSGKAENRTDGIAKGWANSVESWVADAGNGTVTVVIPAVGNIRFQDNAGSYTCLTPSLRNTTLVRTGDGGWSVTYGMARQFIYDSAGKLISDKDASGVEIAYSYTDGKLTELRDVATGKWLRMTYVSGAVQTVYDESGRTATLTYNGTLLSSIKDVRNITNSFVYDAFGHMTELRGNSGELLTKNVYDTAGRVISQTDARGNTGNITYTNVGTSGAVNVTVADRMGHNSAYAYSADGRLTAYTNPLGKTWSYGFDNLGQMTQVTTPCGRVSTITYDSEGNQIAASIGTLGASAGFSAGTGLPTSLVAPGNRTTTITRNAALLPTAITGPTGSAATIAYNSSGQPTSTSATGGYGAMIAYQAGLPATITSASGLSTALTYDTAGRPATIVAPGNLTYSAVFDAGGHQTSATVPGNKTVSTEYDSRGRPTKTTLPDSTTTTSVFDGNHNLTSQTDQAGRVTTYVYDAEDRLASMTEPGNRTTTVTRDAAGRVTSVLSPGGKTTSFAYDDDNNQISTTGPDLSTSSVVLDTTGLPSTTKDAENHITQLAHNAAGDVSSVTSPENRLRSFNYDAGGRATKAVMPSGKFSSISYDDAGRTTTIADPAAKQTVQAFDTDGRLVSVTTPGGHSTTYAYGTDGKLSTATLPSGKAVQFAYGADGATSSVTDGSGATLFTRDIMGRVTATTKGNQTVSRTYDALGRVLTYTDAAGNVVGYAYDPAGNLASITYPDTTKVTYGYDADGFLTTVTDWNNRVTNISRDAAGRSLSIALPNGTTNACTYTANGRIANIVSTGPGLTTIASRLLTFTPDGLTASETGMTPPGTLPPDVKLTFDADNRITAYNGGNVTYDADGNMLLIPAFGTLLSTTFDAAGRLAVAGNVTSSYDPEGRRTKITDTTGNSSLVYDTLPGLDRLLVKNSPDGTTTKYVYGDGLLYEVTGSTLRAYHYDSRGSTIALTDAAGAVTDTFSYGPYGETWNHAGTTNTSLRFCGQYGVQTDSNGLLSMRARFYSPEIKRFVSQDSYLGSALSPLSLNRFSYAECNPISLIDPAGFAAADYATGVFDAAKDTIVGTAMLGYNIGGTIGYVATTWYSPEYANSVYGDQVDGLLNAVRGLQQIGSTLVSGDYDSYLALAESMSGGNRSGAYRSGYTTFSLLAGALGGKSPFAGKLAVAENVASKEPLFVSAANKAGGRVWASTDEIFQIDFAHIVENSEGRTTVLTGQHGNPFGGSKPARKFFDEDLKKWRSQTSKVKIIDFTKLSSRQRALVLNREGTVICAWCFSTVNPDVAAIIGTFH